MATWLRVLIGVGIGLVGVGIYLAARLRLETAKKVSWGDVAWLVVIALAGLLLAGAGDRILRPVSVAPWLRWAFIGFGFAVSTGCVIIIGRGRLQSTAWMITTYVVGLVLGLLAVQLLIAEIT